LPTYPSSPASLITVMGLLNESLSPPPGISSAVSS
jgi:hypothetical protein